MMTIACWLVEWHSPGQPMGVSHLYRNPPPPPPIAPTIPPTSPSPPSPQGSHSRSYQELPIGDTSTRVLQRFWTKYSSGFLLLQKSQFVLGNWIGSIPSHFFLVVEKRWQKRWQKARACGRKKTSHRGTRCPNQRKLNGCSLLTWKGGDGLQTLSRHLCQSYKILNGKSPNLSEHSYYRMPT